MRWFISFEEYRERFPSPRIAAPRRNQWLAPPRQPDGPLGIRLAAVVGRSSP
jgi:hypothetical protein